VFTWVAVADCASRHLSAGLSASLGRVSMSDSLLRSRLLNRRLPEFLLRRLP